jgi:hypothetical protein
MINAPNFENPLAPDHEGWEAELKMLVQGKAEFSPPEMYCLCDRVKAKYNQPYFPEKESDEQSVKNAIRVKVDGAKPVEVSTLLPRLKPLTQEPVGRVRYYLPRELQREANELLEKWNTKKNVGKFVHTYDI